MHGGLKLIPSMVTDCLILFLLIDWTRQWIFGWGLQGQRLLTQDLDIASLRNSIWSGCTLVNIFYKQWFLLQFHGNLTGRKLFWIGTWGYQCGCFLLPRCQLFITVGEMVYAGQSSKLLKESVTYCQPASKIVCMHYNHIFPMIQTPWRQSYAFKFPGRLKSVEDFDRSD